MELQNFDCNCLVLRFPFPSPAASSVNTFLHWCQYDIYVKDWITVKILSKEIVIHHSVIAVIGVNF